MLRMAVGTGIVVTKQGGHKVQCHTITLLNDNSPGSSNHNPQDMWVIKWEEKEIPGEEHRGDTADPGVSQRVGMTRGEHSGAGTDHMQVQISVFPGRPTRILLYRKAT